MAAKIAVHAFSELKRKRTRTRTRFTGKNFALSERESNKSRFRNTQTHVVEY